VKGEPTIDAVAFVRPDESSDEAILMALRSKSVIARVNDGES
jgi:hypothetical protein